LFRVYLDDNFDINSLKNAIITKILAKSSAKEIALKVYDLHSDNIDENLALLSKFGFSFSKESYASSNSSFYLSFAMRLMTQKMAFACFCHQDEKKRYLGSCDHLSEADMLNKEGAFAIRAKKPIPNIDVKEPNISYSVKPKDIDSFMILKEDKTPTKVFSNGVDDMLLDIDMIIRDSSEDIDSAREEYLRKLFDYPKAIEFVHLPSIKNAPSIKELLLEGILPDTIANYIINTLTKSKEIKNLEDYDSIELEKIIKHDVEFDKDKLMELNKKHIAKLDDMALAKALNHHDNDIGKLAKELEFDNLNDIASVTDRLFVKKELDEIGLSIAKATKEQYCDSYDEYIEYLSNKLDQDKKVISKSLSDIITDKIDISIIYPYIKNYLVEIIK
jgi:glutamyl-tRNA synthetase